MSVLILTMAAARGGFRPNAGRRSAYPGIEMKPFAMDFTPAGRKLLAALQRRTRLSRNDILAHLAVQHGAALRFDEPGVVYAGKAQDVLAIRLPPIAADVMREARTRTGKSYSDLGEALVRRYGTTEAFPPTPSTPTRKTRRRRAVAAHARRVLA